MLRAIPLVLLALLLILLRALPLGVYKHAEALTSIADGVPGSININMEGITWDY